MCGSVLCVRSACSVACPFSRSQCVTEETAQQNVIDDLHTAVYTAMTVGDLQLADDDCLLDAVGN